MSEPLVSQLRNLVNQKTADDERIRAEKIAAERQNALDYIDIIFARMLRGFPQSLLDQAAQGSNQIIFYLHSGIEYKVPFKCLPSLEQIRSLDSYQSIDSYCHDNGLGCELQCFSDNQTKEIEKILFKIEW